MSESLTPQNGDVKARGWHNLAVVLGTMLGSAGGWLAGGAGKDQIDKHAREIVRLGNQADRLERQVDRLEAKIDALLEKGKK